MHRGVENAPTLLIQDRRVGGGAVLGCLAYICWLTCFIIRPLFTISIQRVQPPAHCWSTPILASMYINVHKSLLTCCGCLLAFSQSKNLIKDEALIVSIKKRDYLTQSLLSTPCLLCESLVGQGFVVLYCEYVH